MNLLKGKKKAENVVMVAGLIAETELQLEEVYDQIRGYSSQARELRNLVNQLFEEGSSDPSTILKVEELSSKALYLDGLGTQLDRTKRLELIRERDMLKVEAENLRGNLTYNERVLKVCESDLSDLKEEYKRRLAVAEEKVEQAKQCIADSKQRLFELEGGEVSNENN